MRYAIAAVLLLAGSSPVLAQNCPEPVGWAAPARHVAAKNPRLRFALEPDSSAQLQLHVQRSVVLATKEGKPGWMDRFAGLAAVDVTKPGKLDVLLSQRAYADLVRDGRTLESKAHRRANCGGIYKIVTFDVEPGRYILQLTGSQARSIRVATIQR
jgi:hypothetical protein